MGDFTKAALVLFCCCNLIACGKDSDKNGPDPLHEKLTGSVVEAVNQVQAGTYTDACDERQAAQRMEIARALDARAGGIQRFVSGLGTAAMSSPEFAVETRSWRTPIAGTYFTERTFVPGKDEWTTQAKSWDALIERFRLIQNQPVNAHWVNLDSNVRGLLVDDINRAVRGMDNGLDHTAERPLQDFQRQIDLCRWLDCSQEVLSPEIQAMMERNSLLKNLWLAYKNAKTSGQAREQLDLLVDRLDRNVSRYSFSNNGQVTRDREALILPLDAGDFGGYESQLAEYIEPIWETAGQHLTIEWRKSNEAVFKMFLDVLHPYSRAFVNWRDKKVQLYTGTDTRAVAHEIGHVLGFRDVYYTLWNADTCSYTVEFNDGDLMSSHRGGVVTEDQWKKLLEEYR